jgi:hypothetical protein
LPRARRERGLRAIAAARRALAAQAAAGNDPRTRAAAGQKRNNGISEAHRRNREWKHQYKEDERDQAWFLREVTPKLDAFSLGEIAIATGLSLAACSRFRAGTRVPHPRHWEAFVTLVESDG